MFFLLAMLLLQTAQCLQHSAAWGLLPGTPSTNADTPGKSMTSLTFDVNNITLINSNWKTYKVQALYPLQWTASQPQQCHAPVHHQCTHPPACNFSCITIDPNYKKSFQKQFALMQPAIKSGALKGIFLGDEHVYFGMKMSYVKLIADLIRTSWPNAIIYMNEAPDVAMCNMNKQNQTIFQKNQCLPVNVDWFGWDFYQHDSTSWTAFREAAQGIVYPRMSRTDQRIVATSLGYSDGSLTIAEAETLDTFCSENARQFLKWGLEDNRLVGTFPFHWNGGIRNANGSITGGAGIIDLPKCAATYRAIGELIINSGSSGTSMDPVLIPPKPNADGSFTEPQCKTNIMPSPSVWSWCNRHNPSPPSVSKQDHTTSLTMSDGCSTLEKSKYSSEEIVKVTFKWAWRVEVAHSGLEIETSSGKIFSLAYNSMFIPGPIDTPGNVWCQEGGMPMKNPLANGDCELCGGWKNGGSTSAKMGTLADFMKDVKKFGDDHPYYNILSCTPSAPGNVANCQSTANHLYKKLTGEYPSKGGCPECPNECNK